jgi:Cytochrome c oxidase subunit IV
MSDDAALLLRVAVFGLVAGVVYWFLSYEWLGTVALLLLGAGPGFAALFILRHPGKRAPEGQSRAEMLRRFAGVPGDDPPGPKSLADEDLAVLPAPSIWPFAASLGLAVALSGLIFGLWLVILGVGMALYSGWGWVAAIVRETRYGHVQPPDRPGEREFGPAAPARPGEPGEEALRRR